MEQPPFQFGLKGVFKATAGAAALMAVVHYIPGVILLLIGAILLYVVLAVMISIIAGNVLSWLYLGILHQLSKRQPPEA